MDNSAQAAAGDAGARLSKKVYEVAPLTYSRRGAPMRIIAAIGQEAVIERILRHLGFGARGHRVRVAGER